MEKSNSPYERRVIWSTITKVSPWLCIFGVSGFYIFDILGFYLGLHINQTLQYSSIFIPSLLVLLFALLRFIQLVLNGSNKLRIIIGICTIIPIIAFIIFMSSFLYFGIDKETNLFYFLQWGCYGIPAFVFGLDCAINKKEVELFKSLDILAFFYLPISLIVIGWLQYATTAKINYTDELGGMSFMTIANAILIPFITLCMGVIFKKNAAVYGYFEKDKLKNNISIIIRLVLILIMSTTILATATRGVQLASICILVMIVIFSFFIKERISLKRISTLIMSVLILMSILVLFKAPFLELSLYKVNVIVDSMKEGELKTSNTKTIDKEIVDKLISNGTKNSASDEANQVAENTKTDVYPSNNAPGIKSEIDASELSMNREQMYYAAIQEWKKSPVIGNGALYFVGKYKRYPHNIVLELLSDYGAVGASCVILIISILGINLFRKTKLDVTKSLMGIFLLGANLTLLFSGEFLASAPFWFYFGYAGQIGVSDLFNKLYKKRGI